MKKHFALLFVLIGSLSLTVLAAVEGKIEGIVTDQAGTPLEKVAINIAYQPLPSINFNVTTNRDGKYSQIGLRPGYYLVTFKKAGFMPKTVEARVGIQETTKLDMKLEKSEEVLERTISESDKLFLKANKLYEEKEYDAALAAYDEAIVKAADQWGYHLNRGLTLKKLGRKADAMTAFARAVELNPESYSTNKEYGESLAKDGRFEDAKKYYKKATELSPDDPDAFFNLGACLVNTGEAEAALVAFQKCVFLKSDYSEAYYQMGTILIGQNKKAEAIASLEKFVELAPDHEKAGIARQLLDYLKK